MSNSPESSLHDSNPFTSIIPSIYSGEGKIMLAAITSLLLVILFVLLLHLYAKWLLLQTHQQRRRRRRRSSISLSHALDLTRTRLHHIHTFTFDDTYVNCSQTNGLDASIIASLPLFIYKYEEHKNHELECVICLSIFEEEDVGRILHECNHAFHVECIDMWLKSHSNCPICRTPVMSPEKGPVDVVAEDPPEILSGESEIPVDNSVGIILNPYVESSIIEEKDSSPPLSSSLSCSLKRMMSRSRSEGKVYPSSSDVNESLNIV